MPESENLPNCHIGYLLTLSVARKLLEASLQVPLFKFEDVYLTGMVAGLAGVAPTDHVGFNQKVCKVAKNGVGRRFLLHRACSGSAAEHSLAYGSNVESAAG